ncbi:DUF1492 domain-containing protein [Parablautia muri]|uniref:DUF1492 domain-containing protein n=1 Tax=Parablautia muri TaxID=2320879 RepID=A0A9X5BD91_9FIRM|nr:DUF1492 domain-containing protein [Parablautia muri]NBJ91623.1 DUF1492 domain-containing protein [Parablautia muri]
MKARDYLGQAFRLDQRINSKIEQVRSLNDLAAKCTSTITGMPGNPNRGKDSIGDTIAKIVDLQEEINRDIDALVDLKAEIYSVIRAIDNVECQTLLELRYLSFMRWEEIAVQLNYGMENIYRLHRKALNLVSIPS